MILKTLVEAVKAMLMWFGFLGVACFVGMIWIMPKGGKKK